KGVFPESHPLFLWPGFGAAAPKFVREIAEECDVTLAIGCKFGEVATASYGMEPHGTLIHVDIDPAVLGRNYPADLPIVSDGGGFVRALLAAIPEREAPPDAVLRRRIQEGHDDVWKTWEEEAGEDGVTPARLLRALQHRFGPRTVFTTDSGNGTFLAMECL